jgi:hypothetical protein
MKVFNTPSGDYSLVMQFGTDDYRLFQNFLAHGSKTLPDARLKQLFERMFAAYQSPVAQTDASKPNVDAGFSSQITGKLDVVSQKIDSVIRAIGGLDNAAKPAAPAIDLSGIEGLIARLEKTLATQVGNKIEAIAEGTVFNGLQGGIEAVVRSEIAGIKAILEQMRLSVSHEAKQLESTTVMPVEPVTSIAAVTEMQAAPKVETPVKTEEKPSAVVSEEDDIVRYPASKKKGAVPKCYGNFKPSKSKEERSPCQSCVWVNECSMKEIPKTDKPECYGQYDAGLKCSSCSVVSDCMQTK